jgi:hypothetical protein
LRSALIVGLGLLAACSRNQAAPAPAPRPAAPVVNPERSLFDRLSDEAKQRNHASPSTSQVLDAFALAGITVKNERQVSAASHGAAYCVMFDTDAHVTLRVCEFADAATANEGALTSRTALKDIAGLRVEVRRSTVLSVIDSQGDAASAVIARTAREAFEAL